MCWRFIFYTWLQNNKRPNGLYHVFHGIFFIFLCASTSAQNESQSLVSIKGVHFAELFQTNFRIPRFGIANQYLRIGGQAAIGVKEIPFQLEYFVTSEPQTIYKTNYFKFRFDKNSLLQNLNAQNTLYAKFIQNRLENIKNERAKLKLSLHLDSIFTNSLNNEFQLNETEIKLKKQKLDSFIKSNNPSNKINIPSLTDQISLLKKDSLLFAQKKLEQTIDRNSKFKKLNYFDSLFTTDTSLLSKIKYLRTTEKPNIQHFNNLNGYQTSFYKWIPILQKIQTFDIGVVNPVFNKNSFYGNSLRGFQLGINVKNTDYEVVAGKIQSFNLKSFSRFSTDFNSWAFGFKSTIYHKSIETSLYTHSINSNSLNSNVVIGFFSKIETKNHFEIQGGFASCLDNNQINFYRSSSDFKNWMQNKSMDLLISKSINSNLNLEFSNKSIGLNFQNYGNPFMIKGLIQNQLKLKSTLFQQNLNVAIFYKYAEYLQFNETAFPMLSKGVGISVKSQFKNKKIPNFTLNYTPFEQGNNHPDSMFRVYTKTAVYAASIFQNIRISKKWTFLYQGMYMKNQVIMNSVYQFNNSNFNLNLQLESREGILLNFSIINSTTAPKIDSLESITYMGSIMLGKEKLKFGVNVLQTQYLNGGQRASLNGICQFEVNRLQIFNLNLSYEYINQIWGLYSKYIYAINLKYIYKLDFSSKRTNLW